MAKAIKSIEEYEVTLTLSKYEAQQLLALTKLVFGGQVGSHGIGSIHTALDNAGVEPEVFRSRGTISIDRGENFHLSGTISEC